MNQALRNVRTASTNTNAPVSSEKDKIGALMDRLKPQLAIALPSALNPERVARIALTELRQNAKLAEAAMSNPLSFAGAMLRAATLGFEVGNGLGHAYLVPYEKRAKQNGQWVTVTIETQLILGYRGMIELARRSGQIESLYAVEVYAGEPFDVELGLSNNIKHTRRFDVDTSPDAVVAVYAVAKLKGGEVQFEVMGRNQVEAIRVRSKAKDSGPWVTDWAEMAKKTVVRRLFKYLPVSIEVKTSKETRNFSLEQLANDDAMTIDATTGEFINAESATPALEGEKVDATGMNDLFTAINASTSVAELDEIFVRAENTLSNEELEEASKAYQARKQVLGR